MAIAEQVFNKIAGKKLSMADMVAEIPSFEKWVFGEPDADGVRTDVVTFADGSEIEVTARIKAATAGTK
jgi:hypothetical protein